MSDGVRWAPVSVERVEASETREIKNIFDENCDVLQCKSMERYFTWEDKARPMMGRWDWNSLAVTQPETSPKDLHVVEDFRRSTTRQVLSVCSVWNLCLSFRQLRRPSSCYPRHCWSLTTKKRDPRELQNQERRRQVVFEFSIILKRHHTCTDQTWRHYAVTWSIINRVKASPNTGRSENEPSSISVVRIGVRDLKDVCRSTTELLHSLEKQIQTSRLWQPIRIPEVCICHYHGTYVVSLRIRNLL